MSSQLEKRSTPRWRFESESRLGTRVHNTNVRRRCAEPSCWFEDGNVVLEAQSTIFKVYKGLLSQESEVFKSMFTLPQPSSGPSELYDGCPLVVLQDSAADIQVFIQAIFNHNFLTERLDRSPICASLLAITTKYQAQRLRQRVMDPLFQAFPNTLTGFHAAINASATCAANKGPSSWSWEERIVIANAARKSRTSILLPAFLLSSSLRSLDDILRTRTLSEVDRYAIIAAIPKLSVAAREEVYSALFSSDRDLSPNCTQPTQCYQSRHAMMQEIEERPNAFNPFHQLEGGTDSAGPGRRLCDFCAVRIADSEEKMQAEWDRLPGIFGLGSWDELRKAEKNAAAPESVA